MTLLGIRVGLSILLLSHAVLAATQPADKVDNRMLEDLRKRYQHSLQSIYITDAALNNLNVHLRTEDSVQTVTKSGMDTGALNVFRKFLFDIASDRAFLQLELQQLRALFKRNNDASAGAQLLPWTQVEVFHIAVFCDRYLQGQLILAQLKKDIASGKITLAESWTSLEGLRQNPHVPVITMTDSLKGLVLQAERNESQLNKLAATDPSLYSKIRIFKTSATDQSTPANMHFAFDWPVILKTEWTKKYKLLESYGKTVDQAAVIDWQKQLDKLQEIESAQLVRSTGSQ